MDLPGVSIADSGDSSMFSLSTIKKQKVKLKAFQKPSAFPFPGSFTSTCSSINKVENTKNMISFVLLFLHQSLADISKGDMKAADELVHEDDDLHLSEEDDDEADKMSLASDLDDEDMEEVTKKQEELEKKDKKKK